MKYFIRPEKSPLPYWPDESIYFLTDSTFLHYPYFKTDAQKEIILNQIKKIYHNLKIPVSAYSIASNHYHLKIYLEKGLDLAKVKQLLRGGISYEYKKRFGMDHKEMWQNWKVIRVGNEAASHKITGYIIGNLIKHKEVNSFTELKENKFSSCWFTVKSLGEQISYDLICQVIDVDEDKFGVVDVKGF
jgi:hypothetical protein